MARNPLDGIAPRGRPRKANAKTSTERSTERYNRLSLVARRECADPARRKRLEADPAKWLKWYLGPAFPDPWSPAHLAMINGAVEAAATGNGVAVAAPRGVGKTTTLRGVAFFLQVTGRSAFPVLGGWTISSSTAAFGTWIQWLSASPRLAEDYPEVTQPFEVSTNSARLRNLRWADTGERIGADVRSLDKLIVLPDSRGAIAARSVQGDVKGLNAILPDGSVIRPDLLLLDDAQDPKRADDQAAVAQTVERIEKQWICLAGPRTRITVMLACTVAAKDDVSEYFLNHPDYKAVRVKRVTRWPDGWDEQSGDVRKLWDEWISIRRRDGQAKALRFYRRNKKAMTSGMEVSWKHHFDAKHGDPDAFYGAMVDFYRVGEYAFASEYQNDPIQRGATVYEISESLIISRTDPKRRVCQIPDHLRGALIGGTDINHYGLHSEALSVGPDHTAGVVWYDCWEKLLVPANAPEHVRNAIVYRMLKGHFDAVRALPLQPDAWIIDGGYAHNVVQRFCSEIGPTLPFRVIVARGFSSAKYNPARAFGSPREHCHTAKWPMGTGMAWDADYWRMVSQRAWLGELGEPGSCSLFAGAHREYAEHLCREKLKEMVETETRTLYVWATAPGRHDWSDAHAMCYAGAAYHAGIGPGGGPIRRRRRKFTQEDLLRRRDASEK